MGNRRRLFPKTGFTLIELLVAICILALVAVLGWRGLDSIIRSRSALSTELERVRGMQLTFAQLQRDCEQLAHKPLMTGRAMIAAGSGRLILVRHVIADNQALHLQVVAYRLIDGQLTRSESGATRNLRELDALWHAATSDNMNSAEPIVLQSGLSSMTMRYWHGNASGWHSSTSGLTIFTASDPAIPTGLEVTLQVIGQPATIKAMLMGAT